MCFAIMFHMKLLSRFPLMWSVFPGSLLNGVFPLLHVLTYLSHNFLDHWSVSEISRSSLWSLRTRQTSNQMVAEKQMHFWGGEREREGERVWAWGHQLELGKSTHSNVLNRKWLSLSQLLSMTNSTSAHQYEAERGDPLILYLIGFGPTWSCIGLMLHDLVGHSCCEFMTVIAV